MKLCAEIFGKELYVVLLADGRDFFYLVLLFIQLIFRQSSINEQYLPLLICIGPFMSFHNEGWTILVIVVCHMSYDIKVALFVDGVIKIYS